MNKVLTCECGFTTRGTDVEIIAAAQEHGRSVHEMDLEPEQVLAMARPE